MQPFKVVGMGEEWKGGDVANGPGGAHKINLLKKALKNYGDRKDLLILFTDAYDVVVTGTQDEIVARFNSMSRERGNQMKGMVFSRKNTLKILLCFDYFLLR